MWLTWCQVVDHVCHSQSSMVKGKCSIDDSLNTKVSPFFDTPFPSSYSPRTKSTSSIKHAHQPLPTIDPPPHRLRKDNIDKVRCHKLFSHYTRSIETPVICMSHIFNNSILPFNLMAKGFFERVRYPLHPSLLWTDSSTSSLVVGFRELILKDCNAVIRFIGSNIDSISTHIQNQMVFWKEA